MVESYIIELQVFKFIFSGTFQVLFILYYTQIALKLGLFNAILLILQNWSEAVDVFSIAAVLKVVQRQIIGFLILSLL